MSPTETDIDTLLPLRPLDLAILIALAEGEQYGYAIVTRIGEREGGAVRLAPGNLYQVLDRMIASGWIEESDRTDAEDERRRYYGLTPFGARLVSAESARLSDLLGTAARLGLAGSGGA
jgi:DNA-binding PadR family transcriptional regulator